MVCFSPVGYGGQLTFRALALRRSRPVFSLLAHAEKQFFSKTSLSVKSQFIET